LNPTLYGALERSRTVHWVIALFGQCLPSSRRHLQVEISLLEQFAQMAELDVDDLANIITERKIVAE